MLASKYFKRHEFSCRCNCAFDTVDSDHLHVITMVREHFNKPLIINCACRCPKHNKKVSGAPRSQHLTGKAADIRVKDVKPSAVYDYFISTFPHCLGIGKYRTFTHVDTRSYKSRW